MKLNYALIIERALQLGTLFGVQDALKVGLVDKIVPDVTNGLIAAESELKEFLQIPGIFNDFTYSFVLQYVNLK